MNQQCVRALFFSALIALFCSSICGAAELDATAVSYIAVDKIQWKDNAAGTGATAKLYGDPTKAEPYAYFNKWKAGNFSHPHFHPNDRTIVVLAGTWWVGSGSKFDPDNTVPLTAGTVVTHTGKGIHYDGAKQGDALLLISGMGPATSTPAEQK